MENNIYVNLRYTIGEYVDLKYGMYSPEALKYFAEEIQIDENMILNFMYKHEDLSLETMMCLCHFFNPDNEIKKRWIKIYATDEDKYTGSDKEIRDAIMLAINNIFLSKKKEKYSKAIYFLQQAINEIDEDKLK